MRHTPDLVFKYDESVEYGSRIETLLKEITVKDDGDDR